ncbi:protein phosphatase 2C domain-containing protein [[Pseudopropionibacterium] massiliense]|uniref:protein phosphatase 2C domain-containing protein n=1 Tax=[Pseudopropionibacterium] massiliense TaxID=2220000 RepID=UPI0013EF0973|nr:protein phosphatase 2C domain-containing protein [[Pseudopropionibacterium] massiliense]
MSDNPILDSETPTQERIQAFAQESRANIPEHVFRPDSPNQPNSSHKKPPFDKFDEIQKPFNSAELEEESTIHARAEIETAGAPQSGEDDPEAVLLPVDTREKLRWMRPAAPDDISVQEGVYRGRVQVGDVGAMLRILPSVGSKLAGAFVPDSIVDSGIVSDSVSIGVVSIKGASHHLSGIPRQDAYAIGSDDSWVVIGIADGVSEGKLSHVAASEATRVAVTEAVRALAASDPADVSWSEVGRKVREAIRTLGKRRAQQQVGPDDTVQEISDRTIARLMSTTCDLLITPNARKDDSLRVWRVRISGDGSLYVLDPVQGWGLLDSGKDPASSTVDNSVSDPLPIGGEHPDVESWELRPGQVIILCTDGFGDVIGEGARPVGRYLFDAWQQPLDTTQLLYTSSFVNTNADDDRTAAIVWATA